MPSSTIKLSNGIDMPTMSLGMAHLLMAPGALPENPKFAGFLPERAYRHTQLALEAGVRAFDGSHVYRTAQPSAQVLGDWFKTGALERKDVWITTSIMCPQVGDLCFGDTCMPNMSHMTPEEMKELIEQRFYRAVAEWNVGYVDMMLLHFPGWLDTEDEAANRKRRMAAWTVLEEMYNKGWTRAIGVANYAPKHLRQLKEDGATIVPMMNQFEASVACQYEEILQYCQGNGIVPCAYSPLAGGGDPTRQLLSVDLLNSLGQKYGKDNGQIALRYLTQRGYAVACLTNNPARMKSNMDIFDFELTEGEMKDLKALGKPESAAELPSPFMYA